MRATRIAIYASTWPLWLCLALILYWLAIHVGLLSDDFVIAQRATHFDLSPLGPQFFRPLPLALWGSILSAGGGPRAFHLLNIILHGTNAYLVTRIVRQPITTYLVQKWVFRPFGGLAVPWHIDVIHHTPWLAVLSAAIE